MSKKEEKKRKIEWKRHCFAISLAVNPKNTSKEKQTPTRILLPKRIEAPSTNLLGKIRQQILSRMGYLRLRGENETLLQLLRKDAYTLSQLVDGSYRYNISPETKDKNSKDVPTTVGDRGKRDICCLSRKTAKIPRMVASNVVKWRTKA